MVVEFSRLVLGLVIALFHKPIADFVMRQEAACHQFFHARGLRLPHPPAAETARNIYFGIGIFVCCFSLLRIWISL